MKSIVTAADMALLRDAAAFPAAFTYAGTAYAGIPADAAVEQRNIDASLTLAEARFQCGALDVRVERLTYRDYPVSEYTAYFTNHSDADSALLENARLEMMLPIAPATLVHSNGDTWYPNGYEWYRTPLEERFEMTPDDGTSCNGAFPYMRLVGDGCGYNLAVGWPARWKASFAPEEGGVRVSAGLRRCATILHPGETIRTPRLTVMGYIGDEDRAANLWRRWYIAHILPRENGQPLPPKLCLHNFCADGHPEFTGATEENQVGALRTYLDKGLRADVWWLDAGWYPCDYNWPRIGTWHPDEKRFPHGLGPLGEAVCEAGGRFMLWFEPERVRPDSELDREHAAWLLYMKNDDGSIDQNRLLDLGNREACDWLIDHVDSIIKESGVTIYRQDFNFNPAPIWEQNEAPDRVGALENMHAQGYMRYWDTLIERNPGLLIDSCASGGRRNDMETMRRAVPFHYSDVGYGDHPIKQKQYATMFVWIPYFRSHNMNWLQPDGSYATGKNQPVDRFSYYAAFTPAITDMVNYQAAEAEYEQAHIMLPLWRRCAEIELDADFYGLTECRKSAEDFWAVQFHNPDHERGFVELIANAHCEAGEHMVTMRALDADAVYRLTLAADGENEPRTLELTGRALMDGVKFPLPPHTAEVWFYEKI